MYLRIALLLLASIGELHVAEADCTIKKCVDNVDCGIEFPDCVHPPVVVGPGTGHSDDNDTSVNCAKVNEFKNTKLQWFTIDKNVEFITLTEIHIPNGVEVEIGHLDCNNECKILVLTDKAVPPIPHLVPLNRRFKISASAPTAIIKFTCERQCFNLGANGGNFMKRIVDGTEAGKNSYPFMARLKVIYSEEDKKFSVCNTNNSTSLEEIKTQCSHYTEPYLCGGSILQKSWILTAQHCVEKKKVSVKRLFGSADSSKDERLTFQELLGLIRKYQPNLDQRKIRALFDTFNDNQLTSADKDALDIKEFDRLFKAVKMLLRDLYSSISVDFIIHLVGVIVTVGDHSMAAPFFEEPEQRDIWVGTENVKRINGYNPDTFNKDVALLKLSTEIDLDINFRYPICLPPYYWDEKDVLKGCLVIAAGWGETRTLPNSDVLMRGAFEVIPDAACLAAYPKMTEYMICTKDGATNTCGGDSGGPTFCQAQDKYYYEVGVTSFGKEDKAPNKWKPNFPSVNAKVTKFLKWIAEIVINLP